MSHLDTIYHEYGVCLHVYVCIITIVKMVETEIK